MVQLTDPLASENEYVVDVMAPDFIPFERFTNHAVPEGNPDSVNVTVYVYSENVTETDDGDPADSVNDDAGAWYILLFVAMLYWYDPFGREMVNVEPDAIGPDDF